MDDGEAELGARKRGTRSVFKARISLGSDLAREGRAMKRLRHDRNSICRDFHHDVVDVNAGAPPPLDLCCVCEGGRKKKEIPLIPSPVCANKTLIFLELSL